MIELRDLLQKKCTPCQGCAAALTQPEIDDLVLLLDGWEQYDHLISKKFVFADFHQTMEFVNAVAWISHREDHHPELTVNYNSCLVEYTTHAIHGLSESDFICAAKVEALLQP